MMASDFLEPERLRAFVTVAETGNFTRAAERLHLTQPAITVQVRRLEESVGKALFERNSRD
jgi:DNA-binding transcriptional LysR family regulator